MTTAVTPHTVHRFSCLGSVSLAGPDGRDAGLRTRKLIALLLLLARQAGKPLSRGTLIELLWSEDSEKRARHSLSQSASLINRTLGTEAIGAADRDRMVLRPGAVWLDVTEFERLAASGDVAEARQLWRGGLLDGVWIQRAPNFERWLADERHRLERVLRRIAHEIIEERRADGDYQGMRQEAESLLVLDPLDEKAMLACLEALQLAGDRTLALRRFGEFERRLKEELDAEPSSALRGWARRNRKGDSGAELRYVPIPRVSETAVLPSPQPIFGRTEEFALLWNAWEATKTGRGAFIILEGDAGIGKTALATKLANQVHVAGGSVCFVRCYRTEKSVPFAPVTAMIRQLSRLPGFVALDPVWIGELTRLVPELRERYPNAPQPMAVDDAARHRLADATVQAAQAVAEEQPLLVVVDDLQDADEATLAALHYLGRQACANPMLEVVVRRPAATASDMERTFVETARSAGFGRFLTLRGLASADIQRLALQVLARKGLEADDQLVSDIIERASGNPLHAIEQALAAQVVASEGLRGVADGAGVPETIDALASDRLSAASSEALLAAQTIAAAGRPLSEYELAEATGLTPAVLSSAIRELESAHFVVRSGPAVAFIHERYARGAESLAEARDLKRIHIRLATLLARSADRNPAARYEVARHYELGAKRSSARNQALAAARFASSVGAVRERADALELAMRVSVRAGDQCIGDLGDCYLTMNDQHGLAKLCATGHPGAERSSLMQYLGIAGRNQSGHATLTETEDELRVLLKDQALPAPQRSAAQLLLLRTADKTGNYDLVKRTARAMRRESSSRGSPATLFAAGYVFLKYYWPGRALALFERALATAQEQHNLPLEQLCRDGLGILLKRIGRYRDSISQFDYSIALARKTLNPIGEATALQNRAVSEQAMGDFDVARATMDDADRLSASFPRWAYAIYNCYNRAVIDMSAGALDKAIEGLETTLKRANEANHLELQVESRSGLVVAFARSRDWTSLAAYSRELSEMLASRPFPICSWASTAAQAWGDAVLRGEGEQAVARVARLARQMARRDVSHWLALELERVHLTEYMTGGRDETGRARVRSIALNFEAKSIVVEAT